jgi:NAD(P)-dependent dehydrogenase (short-subunit alcohol dehydrogenase family)
VFFAEAVMSTSSGLNGKSVVVLGGTSGIGLATALTAAARGAVVTVTSRTAERVAQATREIGKSARGEVANLENEDETRALFERLGPFDHLVYTAGDELLLSPVAKLDLAAARRAFEVRVFGALGAVKHAAPRIVSGGSIVLTHGIAGARPQAGWAVGAAVCGAIDSLTRALAVELAPVRVNAVSPGFVRTPLWSPIPEAEREALFRDAGKKLLCGRVGEANEIAEAYCYLMENSFTTGQTLVVDGGGVLV